MNIWGRSPRRARKTIVLCGEDLLGEAHPQCVSFSKLNFLRGRNLLQSKIAAVTPTIANETNFCQSTLTRYYVSLPVQLVFPLIF
jgi:hypothetical protein